MRRTTRTSWAITAVVVGLPVIGRTQDPSRFTDVEPGTTHAGTQYNLRLETTADESGELTAPLAVIKPIVWPASRSAPTPDQIARVRCNGQTMYHWFSGRPQPSGTALPYGYDFRRAAVHGLRPGDTYDYDVTVWTETGLRLSQSGSVTVSKKVAGAHALQDLEKTGRRLPQAAAKRDAAPVGSAARQHYARKWGEALRVHAMALINAGASRDEVWSAVEQLRDLATSIESWKEPGDFATWQPPGTGFLAEALAEDGATWEEQREGHLLAAYRDVVDVAAALWDERALELLLAIESRIAFRDEDHHARFHTTVASQVLALRADAVGAVERLEAATTLQDRGEQRRAAEQRRTPVVRHWAREQYPRDLLGVRSRPAPELPVADELPEATVAETPEPDPAPTPDPGLERLREIDGLLAQLESDLQERLKTLRATTLAMLAAQRKRDEMGAAVRGVEAGPKKDALRAHVMAGLEDIRKMSSLRDELSTELRELMRVGERRVQALAETITGELEPHAQRRLDAVAMRSALLEAEILLHRGEFDQAIRYAKEVRGRPLMRALGYSLEAMALASSGRPLEALDLLRLARKVSGDAAGAAFAAQEAAVEIQLLRGLQAKTTQARGAYEAEFERWIASKAEVDSKLNANRSRFGWFAERALWRGYYDTATGIGGAGDAFARADEVGIVADDMAQTHVGLGVIIGLREHHTLAEIRSMTDAQFRQAVREKWDYDLPEADAARMRRRVMHAFQLPDLQVIASGETLGAGAALSKELVQRTLSDTWYESALGVGETAGNMFNGWNVFTVLAPSAKVSMSVTLPMKSDAAQAAFGGVTTVGELFWSQGPGGAVLRRLESSAGGRAVVDTLESLSRGAEQSFARTAAVAVSELLVDAGVSHTIKTHVGENWAIAYDALSAMGATSPSQVGAGSRRTGTLLGREVVQATAQSALTRAKRMRRGVEQADTLMSRVRAALAHEPDPSALSRLADDIAAARDVPVSLRTHLRAAVAQHEAGLAVGVQQSLRDVERVAEQARVVSRRATKLARAVELASQVDTVARPGALAGAGGPPAGPTQRARRLAEELADDAADLGATAARETPAGRARRLADELEAGGGTSRRPDPADAPDAVDAPDTVDGPAPRRADDALPGTARRPAPDAAGSPPPVRDVFDQMQPAGARIDWATEPNTSRKLLVGKPDAPTHRADVLVAQNRFDDAVAEYRRVAAEHVGDADLVRVIDDKIRMAHVAQETIDVRNKLRETFDAPERPRLFDSEDALREVDRAIANGDRMDVLARAGNEDLTRELAGRRLEEAHLQMIPDHSVAGVRGNGTTSALLGDAPGLIDINRMRQTSSASSPAFVHGQGGRKLGVVKRSVGMSGHREGLVEEFASRVSETLGRPHVRQRVRGDVVVGELMPPGTELQRMQGPLGSTDAALLAHKDELAEDLVFSMLMGDGDRHFGNYLLTTDGRLLPYDYGLGDLFPDHPYRDYTNFEDFSRFRDQQLGAIERARTAGAAPERIQQELDRLAMGEQFRFQAQIYMPAGSTRVPMPGDEGFEEFVEATMRRHLDWATRQSADGHGVVRSAIVYEDMAGAIQKIADKRGEIVDVAARVFREQSDAAYTRAVVETRIGVMERVLRDYFPRVGEQ